MLIQGHLARDFDHPPRPGWIRVEGSLIAEMGVGSPPAGTTPDLGHPGTLISPGFTDAHIHLPQVDVIGFDGMELLDWLDHVIYPAEARWADPRTAQRQAHHAFRKMLSAGTLRFAAYGTAHPHTLESVSAASRDIPIPGVVGQVLMDRNAPESLTNQPIATPSDAGTIEASVNPRFAVACSDDLLAKAAQLAGSDRFLQTHLAETPAECAKVRDLFPNAPHYTGVYDAHSLLTDRTLLAHCVHLSPEEWRLIAERQSVVVHCPTANTFLQAGTFDLHAAREHGIRLALGSDVAAGPDIAMPRVARAMIEVAKHRTMTPGSAQLVPTPAEAWRMITQDNAAALGAKDSGHLDVGCRADLLIIEPDFDMARDSSDDPAAFAYGRLLYNWTDSFITSRLIAGTPVSP